MRPSVAATAAAFLLGVACAHVEAPSGGPEDETPPALLVTRPDTFAVVAGWDAPAVLVFDERVSERGVQDAVLVSPRTSAVLVDHRGDEIRVRLREGWVPGTIYQVSVLPGVQDLFGNPVAEPATLVFSTGPAIPDTEVAGVVRDPITGRPEAGIRVEAVRSADSLVYAIPTDSAGGYRIRRVPEGEYALRAFRDLNRNRALDEFEPRAVAAVTLAAGDSVVEALGILMPDSTAAVLASVERVDSLTLELLFDDYLDPTQEFAPAAVQIRSSRGVFVPISAVSVGPGEDAPGGGRREGPEAAADTASEAPLPSRSLRVTLGEDARLEPGQEYSIRVRSVRNLVGLEAPAETTLELPEEGATPPPDPALPTDSLNVIPTDTVAPRDTVAPTDTARVGGRSPGRT